MTVLFPANVRACSSSISGMGLTDYEKHRAGNNSPGSDTSRFCADIYGKGASSANHVADAGIFRSTNMNTKATAQLLRARANAGLEALRRQKPLADPKARKAIGYCFSG